MSKLGHITFIIRPLYGKKTNLIEVHSVSVEHFLEVLKPVCIELNATSGGKHAVGLADHALQFHSDIGSFYISFTEWEDIFIDSGILYDKSSANNSTLELLAKAFNRHEGFEQKHLSYEKLREYR